MKSQKSLLAIIRAKSALATQPPAESPFQNDQSPNAFMGYDEEDENTEEDPEYAAFKREYVRLFLIRYQQLLQRKALAESR